MKQAYFQVSSKPHKFASKITFLCFDKEAQKSPFYPKIQTYEKVSFERQKRSIYKGLRV